MGVSFPLSVILRGRDRGLTSILNRTGSSLGRLGGGMAALARRIALPATAIGIASVATAAKFEQSMLRVQALTGATESSFAALRNQARELGRTTQYSASQSAGGMGFLAQAGFKANQILGAMPGTLDLAAAAQLDLAQTADIASNVLTGYRFEASKMGLVSDVLAKSFVSANTNLEQLGEAMKIGGPVAAGMKIPFQETAAAISLMGNAGYQGTLAGTALRGALVRLATATPEVQRTFAKLKIHRSDILDSEGNVKSLIDVVEQLERSGASTADVLTIFGQRAGPAMVALLGQGSPALRRMTRELRQSGGTASRVADVQMSGLTGAFLRLKSAAGDLAISVGEDTGLLGGLTRILNTGAKALAWAADWEKAVGDVRRFMQEGFAPSPAARNPFTGETYNSGQEWEQAFMAGHGFLQSATPFQLRRFFGLRRDRRGTGPLGLGAPVDTVVRVLIENATEATARVIEHGGSDGKVDVGVYNRDGDFSWKTPTNRGIRGR